MEVQATGKMTVSAAGAALKDDLIAALGYAAFVPVTPSSTTEVVVTDPAVLQSTYNLFGLNDQGHIITGASGAEVRWSEFVRAFEIGLLDGDPFQLIVFSGSGVAGGLGFNGLLGLAEWACNNREVALKQLATLGVGWLLGSSGRALLKLPGARRRQLAQQWLEDGLTPLKLEAILARRQRWDPDRLSPHLGLTATEARALLGELGYAADEAGLFHLSADSELRGRRAPWRANARYSSDVEQVYLAEDDNADQDSDHNQRRSCSARAVSGTLNLLLVRFDLLPELLNLSAQHSPNREGDRVFLLAELLHGWRPGNSTSARATSAKWLRHSLVPS